MRQAPTRMDDDIYTTRQLPQRRPFGGRPHLVERDMLVAVEVGVPKEELRGVVRRHLPCRVDRVEVSELRI